MYIYIHIPTHPTPHTHHRVRLMNSTYGRWLMSCTHYLEPMALVCCHSLTSYYPPLQACWYVSACLLCEALTSLCVSCWQTFDWGHQTFFVVTFLYIFCIVIDCKYSTFLLSDPRVRGDLPHISSGHSVCLMTSWNMLVPMLSNIRNTSYSPWWNASARSHLLCDKWVNE